MVMTEKMEKFLIVGGGGRESVFARRLMNDAVLYAVSPHENPTIIDCVRSSGGAYLIGNTNDAELILNFAKQHAVDYVFVNADDPMANGVVDALLANGIKAIGGTKAASRIEWDKIYAIEMMQEICPQFTPFYRVVSSQDEMSVAVQEFADKNMLTVVKPQGLTGGKGVKVMPEHLPDYQDAVAYGLKLLQDKPEEKVLLTEKLNGFEFTVMGITDGEHMVLAPATYDYPFRFDDDKGAGTGGMGCFTSREQQLPFLDGKDLADCHNIMQSAIDEMGRQNLSFNGVLNGGFFKTQHGIRFMEFNARFGDPEALNILSILGGSFADLLKNIWRKNLVAENVNFIKKASVVKYLVMKEYPQASEASVTFTVDEDAIQAMGIKIYYGACVKTGENQYETLKKSRVMALAAMAEKIEDASMALNEAIEKYISGDLDYRKDIGGEKNLKKLRALINN